MLLCMLLLLFGRLQLPCLAVFDWFSKNENCWSNHRPSGPSVGFFLLVCLFTDHPTAAIKAPYRGLSAFTLADRSTVVEVPVPFIRDRRSGERHIGGVEEWRAPEI